MDAPVRTRVLELARWAPNIDNGQPFFFSLEGKQLGILRDQRRDRRRGNAGNYASLVGLGCLLEYLRIAASAEGLRASFRLMKVPEGDRERWAEVRFESGATPDPLLPGLKRRASDRRIYQGGSLRDPVFQQVDQDLARFNEVNLAFLAQPPPGLTRYLKRANAVLWQDKLILPEVLRWIRWNDQDLERTRDGMSWRSLAISYPVSRLMQLVFRSTMFRSLMRRSGIPQRQQEQQLLDQLASSAALGCIFVREVSRESVVDVGRAFVRAWLTFTLAGFGLQVMASPALHALQYETGVLPDDLPGDLQDTFAGGRAVLTDAFGVPGEAIPVWMFRTGQSPPLPRPMRTLRRPLKDWLV